MKKIMFYICGIESSLKEEEENVEIEVTADCEIVHGSPYWTKKIDYCAVLILAATGFLIAFFNKF